jgi:hypothetical protein
MSKPKCGAKRHKSKETCKLPAGWGTEHPGTGRCKLHGGCSTGPRDTSKMLGHKRTVKTGEHETILHTSLTEKEIELYCSIDWEDKKKQICDEIALLTIRENRMLDRIANLNKAQDGMTIVSIELNEGTDGKNKTVRMKDTLGQIQNIEEALTRVQEKKGKMIEILHKIDNGANNGDGTLKDFVEGMNRIMSGAFNKTDQVDQPGD